MMSVVLDDSRVFRPDCTPAGIVYYVRTLDVALTLLDVWMKEGLYIDNLFLDHDLGEVDGVKQEIKPFVYKLEELGFNETPLSVGLIFIHTSNPSVRRPMQLGLSKYYHTAMISAHDYFEDMGG